MVNKIFLFDNKIRKKFKVELLAGVDEVGRGCIFGPIVSAAVVFDSNNYISHLKESKSVSHQIRKKLFKEILKQAKNITCSIIPADLINQIGISKANILVMKNAVENLKIVPDIVLIDGYYNPEIKFRQFNIIKGDKKSAVIAAASIVAKVVRDYVLDIYHKLIPYYNLCKNKGYATLEHRKQIFEIGLSELHRYYAYKFVNYNE